MQFESQTKLFDFLKGAQDQALGLRTELGTKIGIDQCYYEGIQWLAGGTPVPSGYTNVVRYFTNFNPDAKKLRVTANRITKYTIKSAAATEPAQLTVEVFPPDADCGPTSLTQAQLYETVLNAAIDDCRLLEAAKNANHGRCVCGTYGIGLYVCYGNRQLDFGEGPTQMLDRKIRTFVFDPTRLIVDVANKSRDLADHEYVIYTDVMTAKKIRDDFGVNLDESKLSNIGHLVPVELEMNRLSQNKLYSQYKTYSNTKGARVHIVYVKDDSGRFGQCYTIIEPAKGDLICPNFASPYSPFGGNGLPLFLLHAHRRTDTMWGISDVSMMKDDQDRLNLLMSQAFRIFQKMSGYTVVIDKRTIPRGTSEEEFTQRLTNQAGGAMYVDMGRRDENRQMPVFTQTPQPPPIVMDMAAAMEASMREQAFRSEGSFGVTKSHVPDSSFQSAIEQADQILDIRVRQDVETYQRLMHVLLGTVIQNAQSHAPSTLAMLRKAGLDEQDFAMLMEADPLDPGCTIKLRESSIRHRSPQSRLQEIKEAAQLQFIDPLTYRMTMASDLDMPLTQADRNLVTQANRAAVRIMSGEEWTPLPLGAEGGQVFITAFRAAMLDKKCPPDAIERLYTAILAQQEMMMEEAMATNPEAMQPQQAAPAGAAPQEPQTLGDLLNMATSGGGAASAGG